MTKKEPLHIEQKIEAGPGATIKDVQQIVYLWPQMEAVRTRLSAARADETSVKLIADL